MTESSDVAGVYEPNVRSECPCNNGDERAVGAWIASLIDPIADMATRTTGLMHAYGGDPKVLTDKLAEFDKAVARVEKLRADYFHVELFHAEAAAVIEKALADTLPSIDKFRE